ncbi:MAG: rhodanese-like domain-containing protein [Candidatus Methylopumilus sp.]|nr:rhodanese-like domain-containing protein [Candidatus Methylopumilus sp.]
MTTFITIDASTLSSMLKKENMLLIDVRNDDEVVKGIIKGAKHIPLAILPQEINKLPKKSSIVFYCHSGVRSAHAASYLAEQDYHDVYNLAGGVIAWANAGFVFSTLK